ncbi:tripartite tricarboxylate transporter substrate binding protein [Bradyrhizobium sp. LHD-71]|uniref:Bug family tripartite tricarboxylate transporter substrate binding protein n=1 Tax=Bradyrhizobium sp. LHD-71 TaxID=3072141 RepID=UPI00280CC614|nr:tripartite tricarboxylate transporter substrate binding protein [Bradyrhizobium sp. LHD-71]MDQ8726595.1 tripartite tricarboxylate transporter substrate binding protein [Bradyrhizobium sp. LHD-71]
MSIRKKYCAGWQVCLRPNGLNSALLQKAKLWPAPRELATRNSRRVIMKRAQTSIAALFASALCLSYPATAQDYPNRPITIIVPFTPGASTDAIARVAAQELSAKIGQTVVVENKPGAGTVLGAVAAKNAKPDGYTLFMATNSFYASALTLKNPGYDPVNDFVPLVALGVAPYVLIAPASVPSKSLKELVGYAKANPGRINYGSLGRGTSQKILAEDVKEATGMDWQEIPYKGGTEGVAAAMAGDIHGYFATVSLAAQHVDQPKLNLVAIAARKRSAYLPAVPTFAEAGYPNIVDETWYALFVSSKTPQSIVDRLRAELAIVAKSPELTVQLKKNSIEPYEGTLQEFERDASKTHEKFAASLKKFGIEPE